MATTSAQARGTAQMEDPVILFGAKQALFSTQQVCILHDAGRRPHRKAPSPPPTPAVAYSNVVRAAVDMARYWRDKLPRIAWSVFPDGAWEIEDLWDVEDIHIYTPKLCQEALRFLGQDNIWTLNRFADDWARAHPGDLSSTVGKKSMADIYDPTQPMAVVDKIFKYGEHNLFPRQFLYRAAKVLRSSMLADEERSMSLVATTHFTSPPITAKQPDKQQEPAKPPSTRKKNRKQTRSRPKKLMVPTEPIRPYRHQEHTMPYDENFPRHPVTISRGPSGHLPPMHAAPANYVAIPTSHVPPPPMAHPVNLQHPGPMHASMPDPHYVHQAPPTMIARDMRGVPGGDMTNTPYYTNSRPQYVIDPARTSRREKPYGNTLYDPYNGTKPAFNDYGGAARKPSRTGFMDNSSRKMSAQSSRSRVGSSGTDWGESGSNSNRFSDHRSTRHHHNMKDDPIITNDPLRGCHHTWIGPENEDVNELFIGDLPGDVQAQEVEAMFFHVVNIKPTRVNVRKSMSSVRPHAFVMFDNASQAKLALGANHGNPQIRGAHLRVTVPRRFYQKADDHITPPQRVVSASLKPAGPIVASSVTQPFYTSQDARSDLQKEAISTPVALTAPAPLPKASEVREEAETAHEFSEIASEVSQAAGTNEKPSPEPKNEACKVASTDDKTSFGQNSEVPEIAATANETSLAQETEVQTVVDADNGCSPEQKAEDEVPPVSHIAEQTESLEQPYPLPSEIIEETTGMSPVGEQDTSKLVAIDQHVDAAELVPRVPSPPQTITGGHARLESQTKTTYEDTEGIAKGHAFQNAIVKVPELRNEESTSIKHEDSVETDAESVAVDDPAPPQSAPLASSGLKVDHDDLQQPAEAAKSPSHAEAAKQHGPSQTQSLNPFAKINKSKREKNKKFKKKEQKQEQKQEQKREGKTAQTDVVKQATSAQEIVVPPSVEVTEETQVKVTDTSATNEASTFPGSDITSDHQTPPTVPNEQLDPHPESDDVSIGSSSTLHPNVGVELTPPSPDVEDFHTPLQTPTAISAPQQDESAKRNKKKRNKSKKKKTPTGADQTENGTAQAPAPGSSTANAADQPTSFAQPPPDHVQMHYDVTNSFRAEPSYMDSLRAATRDPTTYFSIVNCEMAEEKRAKNRR